MTERPPQPFQLPDRRMVRRPTQHGNTAPWHLRDNPGGLAGIRLPGPDQVQR